MNKILESYAAAAHAATSEHIEFELRFKIPSLDEYKALLAGVIKSARVVSVSRTVNIIKETAGPAHGPPRDRQPRTNMIATQTYAARDATLVKDGALLYTSKKQIDTFNVATEFIPFKIVVSAEAAAPEFATNPVTLLRIKLRLSAAIAELASTPQAGGSLASWRFDFTLTSELTNLTAFVKTRDVMFAPNITADNYVEIAPFAAPEVGRTAHEFEVEWIGSDAPTSADIYTVLDFVRETGGFKYSQSAEYQAAVFDVAKLLYPPGKAEPFRARLGLKHLTSPPISLDKATWFSTVLPNITKFVGTIKADGVGVVGHVSEPALRASAIATRPKVAGSEPPTTGSELRIIGADLTKHAMKRTHDRPTIYLAELVNGTQYVFDVYMLDGKNLLSTAEIAVRIKYIPEVVAMVNGPDTPAAPKTYTAFTTDYGAELKRLWDQKYPFPVDGIIFGDRYKWKPTNKLTIDFLTMRAPASILGRPPHVVKPGYVLYFLFCGINKTQEGTYRIHPIEGYGEIFRGRTFYDYYPIQFAPPSAPTAYMYYRSIADDEKETVHGRICEYRWEAGPDGGGRGQPEVASTPSLTAGRWHFERIRVDRDVEIARGSYFGNAIAVANSNWNIIQDPLTFDMLRMAPEDADVHTPYFGETDERYKPANAFSSFVKNESLRAFRNLSWVVDLAAGRGADIGRWGRAGIKNALCVDNDADALRELVTRAAGNQRRDSNFKTVIYTHRANLNDDATTLMREIRATFPQFPADGAPLVACNMAIHYMCASDVSINNFVHLVERLCAVGGHFVFTCMNGARVFEQIGTSDRLDFYDETTLKYSVVRAYPKGAKFHNFGQVVQPLLACAGGQYRDEFLVNIDYVVRMFKARGFKLIDQARFDSLLEAYSIDNLKGYDRMTDADFSNVGLYDYVVLQRAKAAPTEKETKAAKATANAAAQCGETPEGTSIDCDMVVAARNDVSLIIPATLPAAPPTLLPTKDIKARLPATLAADVDRGLLVVSAADKTMRDVEAGWRIEVGASFEIVVEEVREFISAATLWDAYGAQTGAVNLAEFEAGHPARKAGRSKVPVGANARHNSAGLIALKVRRLG